MKISFNIKPDAWQVAKASDLFRIQGGFAFKSSDALASGTRWLKIANVGQGKIKWNEKSFLPAGFSNLHRNFILNSGDLVVAMTRPILSGILKIAILSADDAPCLLNQRVGRIIVNDNVDSGFLFHLLKTRKMAYQLEMDLLGTDPPNLSIKTFNSISILLPPLPEQKAIADVLSTWDTAIEKTERLIEAKERRFRGLIQELIGDVCHKWEHIRPDVIFDTVSEKNFPDEELLSVTQDRGVIPRSMLEGRVMSPDGSTSGYKRIKRGDFVISLRSFQGGIEYSDYQGILSPAYTVLRPRMEISEEYWRLFLKSYIFIRRYLDLAVIGIRDGKQISIPDFMSVRIPVPPVKDQKIIVQTLSCVQREIRLLKEILKYYKTQKRGLMQKLLNGEWRVDTDCDEIKAGNNHGQK